MKRGLIFYFGFIGVLVFSFLIWGIFFFLNRPHWTGQQAFSTSIWFLIILILAFSLLYVYAFTIIRKYLFLLIPAFIILLIIDLSWLGTNYDHFSNGILFENGSNRGEVSLLDTNQDISHFKINIIIRSGDSLKNPTFEVPGCSGIRFYGNIGDYYFFRSPDEACSAEGNWFFGYSRLFLERFSLREADDILLNGYIDEYIYKEENHADCAISYSEGCIDKDLSALMASEEPKEYFIKNSLQLTDAELCENIIRLGNPAYCNLME